MGSVSAPAADASAGRSDDLDEGVFDPVEDATVVLRLVGDARRGVQLLVERLLVLRERARDHDVEVHELVAAPGRAEMRHALATQANGLAMLCAGGDVDLRPLALDRRHVELVAERGLRRGDAKHVHEVVALALEARMVLEPDEDVEVARGAAAHPGFALAGDPELLPVVDARRDGEGDVALPALAALAAAAGAELV